MPILLVELVQQHCTCMYQQRRDVEGQHSRSSRSQHNFSSAPLHASARSLQGRQRNRQVLQSGSIVR